MSVLEQSLTVEGEITEAYKKILSKDALDFIKELHTRFNDQRLVLLENRKERQSRLDVGEMPSFLDDTRSIREENWTVDPVPEDIQDRRVEITGPVERKMVINALNSGANVFMADFEDSYTPSWDNMVQGQINLYDAVRKTITYVDSVKHKKYQLNEKHAILFVRPRGWHLDEKHLKLGDTSVSGALFDFGMFFFHNSKEQLSNGTCPYFYLPKLESHLEARLWNDVFVFSQDYLGIPQGTVKATVLIETILAAFEMDEILYELRNHSAGLNCGRWDYIFSYIKKFNKIPGYILPERGQVTMEVPFMKAYSELTIKVCHRRQAHAMGGMAAQIPIKNNEEENRKALAKVSADKEREARAGHDGTWVAHPGLISIAKAQFDKWMPTPNQIHVKRDDVRVSPLDLLAKPEGSITKQGFINNIDVSLQYLESWVRGVGCVPIYNLMEDAATAEISRAQLWQWIHWKGTKLSDGTVITEEMFESELNRLVGVLQEKLDKKSLDLASRILKEVVFSPNFPNFLTSIAYREL